MGLPWQLIKASSFCCPIFWLRKQLRQEKAISQVAALIAYTANYNIGKYIFSLLGGYKVQIKSHSNILFFLIRIQLHFCPQRPNEENIFLPQFHSFIQALGTQSPNKLLICLSTSSQFNPSPCFAVVEIWSENISELTYFTFHLSNLQRLMQMMLK